MKRKVLLIDDEKDLCILISGFLTRQNYQVECAHTIFDGLHKIEEFNPDILLLDNNLPDGLGWDRADEIHQHYPDLRITLLSGGEAERYKFNYPHFTKPVSLNHIARSIEYP